MLEIEQLFSGVSAKNSDAGDANVFLRNILVEVVAENYKQMLHEWLFFENHKYGRLLDPPLRANERVMSGLFAKAISTIAERSRPEVRIDKLDLQDQDIQDEQFEYEPSSLPKAGHIDYLVWYSQRVIGIELKMVSMNCDTCKVVDRVQGKWDAVVKQAKQAQNWLKNREKEDKVRYPRPISLGLMVVVGRRATNSKNDQSDEKVKDKKKEFLSALKKINNPPQFIASYEFPKEFRNPAKIRHGAPGKEEIYIPFVAFISRSAANRTK